MRRMAGLVALAVLFSFGTVAVSTYAGETASPQKKEKKTPGGKLMFAGEEKKDKKKPGN